MKARLSVFGFPLAAVLALASCQSVDTPPAQNLLSVQLDDSLKQYDLVHVDIYDRDSSSRLLKKLWDARLPSPASDIPSFDMQELGTNRFIIKVTGFKAGGQLALQTRIFYAPPPDHPTVLHDTLPPLVPLNRLESLKPSVGVLSPSFSLDSTNYQIKMPEKMDSVNLIMTTPYPGVTIQINGSIVASGTATKYFKIGNTPDTLYIKVTDVVSNSAFTRDYQVIVYPTLPQGVSLATLVPSQGHLGTDFTPQQTFYNLYMDAALDTVSFLVSPANPGTMQVTVDGLAALPGLQSQVITVAKGAMYTVPIRVTRGTDSGYYQITLDHTQVSHH